MHAPGPPIERATLRRAVVAATALALTLPVAQAGAATTWRVDEQVSTAAGPGFPIAGADLAGNPRGEISVSRSAQGGTEPLTERFRPLGGPFRTATGVAPAGQAAIAKTLLLPDGGAVAVYGGAFLETGQLQVAERTATGAWGARRTLGSVATVAAQPSLLTTQNAAGDIAVAWASETGWKLVSRSRAGVWSAVEASPRDLGGGAIALDEQRTLTIAWVDGIDVRIQSRPAAGTWRHEATFVNPTPPGPLDLDVAGNGQGALAFSQSAAFRAAGGSWTLSRLPINRNIVFYTEVDAAGIATVLYTDGAGGLFAAEGSATTGLRPAVRLLAGPLASRAALGMNSAGKAVVLATRAHSEGQAPLAPVALTRTRSGQAWSGAVALPLPKLADGRLLQPQEFADERVLVDDQGNAAAVAWADAQPLPYPAPPDQRAFVYALDAAGPRLDGLVVPATAEVGIPVQATVAPVDVWSKVASTSWDFGNGTPTVGGATATHTYASAGTRTIRVRSSDSLGNLSTTIRTITVKADTTAPVLTGFAVTPVVLDPGPGSTLTVTASEAVGATLNLFRYADGLQPLGVLPLPIGAGPYRLPLNGGIATAYGPGVYILILEAKDAAGNAATPVATLFVVR